MTLVESDAQLAELAQLDVVDVLVDGTLCLNADFVADCARHYADDPSRLGTIFQDRIVARALERGYAGCVDADGLALCALELGAAEQSRTRP